MQLGPNSGRQRTDHGRCGVDAAGRLLLAGPARLDYLPRLRRRYVAVRTVVQPWRQWHDLWDARILAGCPGSISPEAGLEERQIGRVPHRHRGGGPHLGRRAVQHAHGLVRIRIKPGVVGLVRQQHHHTLFLAMPVVVLKQRVVVGIDSQHGVGFHDLAVFIFAAAPQAGKAQRLAVGARESGGYLVFLAPVGLEDGVGRYDAELAAAPGRSEVARLGDAVVTGVEGVQFSVEITGARGYQAPSPYNGFALACARPPSDEQARVAFVHVVGVGPLGSSYAESLEQLFGIFQRLIVRAH